ncbi:MAG: hypothetical protein RI980_895 [Bacteroidota bacterium]|jgi:hypothetical protein
MKKNEQNRNFTISSKVSSSQKAMYMQEAERLNLSLSEWMCGTLDMSINAYKEVDKSEMLIQLQEDNNEMTNIIYHLKLQLNKANARLQQKRKIIAELQIANSENDGEVYYYLRTQK